MAIYRASPVELRKALEVANLFTKIGLGFVPVPVASSEEYDRLTQEVLRKLAEFEMAAGAKGESK
jgi:hypothetical protein